MADQTVSDLSMPNASMSNASMSNASVSNASVSDQSVSEPTAVAAARFDALQAARMEAFVNCTADAIIAFDREGAITFWNGGAERIFGYTTREAIGQSYTLLGTPEVYSFQHTVFSRTLCGDAHQWYDTRRRHKDGRLVDVSITTSPLLVHGVKEGAVAVVRDISEKVRVATELQERNERLDALVAEQRAIARQMAELNAQLHAQAEEKRRFVNMVIHDLRHPLTSMRTILYLMQHDDDPEQREAYMAAITGRLHALAHLLNELTDYHRIEAGHVNLAIEPTDVGMLLRECVVNFAPALAGNPVQLTCHVEPELGVVATDSGKLTHIVLNLLSNALKFTSQGAITVEGHCEGDRHWALTVTDTGIGMEPEVLAHVYEEFYQGDAARRRDGSGLGLSIARHLCDALQGDMELTSAVGEGTRFRLIFPRDLHAAYTATAGD